MKKIIYTALALLIPAAAFAQRPEMSTLDGMFAWFIRLIDAILIPLAFSLALIFFLFGVFKYLFSSGANAEENRSQGKKYIAWAIIGFVVMVSIWGIVNVITNTFGFQNATRPALPCFSGNNCNKDTSDTRSNAPSPFTAPSATKDITTSPTPPPKNAPLGTPL